MDDRYQLETPEYVGIAYDIAGLGSRFVAALIDSALLAIASALLTLVGWLSSIGALATSAASGGPGTVVLSLIAALATLVIFLLVFGYYIFFEMVWNGQSPGKRLTGLRVLRSTGYPITLLDAVVRNLLRLIDFLPAFYALGAVVMIADPRARRLGDIVARTMVVKERRLSLDAVSQSARLTLSAPVAAFAVPNAERLTADELRLVRGFLDRRATLSPRRRADLARQISDHLMVRLETREVIYDREAFLEQVAALDSPP